HIDCLRGIIDYADGRNEQSWNNRDTFSVRTILIIEAIFSGDEWSCIADGSIVTTFHGTYQHTQLQGIGRIAPTEIIENRGTFDISANGCQVSQRFVNSIDCHMIGVDLAIERVDAI